MVEGFVVDDSARSNSDLHAGYTYLGQFIDHDLTFDDSPPLQSGDGTTLPVNLRTPRFDLDSMYGAGLRKDGQLYEGPRFKIAEATPVAGEMDFVRDENGKALIKDARNDSNIIVAQLHLSFMKFHNKIAQSLNGSDEAVFASTRNEVCRHYQWFVLTEFLPAIVGEEMLSTIVSLDAVRNDPSRLDVDDCKRRLRHFRCKADDEVHMPMEFAHAAFRLGHSMVRASYRINSQRRGLIETFDISNPDNDQADDIRGFRRRPANMQIEWARFFAHAGGNNLVQLARPIDTLIASPLHGIPSRLANSSDRRARTLPFRNLHRGEITHALPTGQEVADEMQIEKSKILGVGKSWEIDQSGWEGGSPNDIAGTGLSFEALNSEVNQQTPLWYYVLREAEEFNNGERLGPVGGRIVAEVLIGMLLADIESILHNGGWRPTPGKFGCPNSGSYRMIDFIEFADS
jgi:hypothetical protein